ncbi:Fe(2+) transporter permease subunit FeoB [Celerinatantimonas diazotrophica]|uniref:Ferrous iron transport protein B n=1 Tax=Celerinatantimonas diazotrophica TaxID=412034 RepID=A0A4R1KGL9_9GAMM|nr:Fe(2+) transporter permease subunit FeoB [Celerinatantimonas diazotrophica]TCK63895.1 ferrous iron transport protein B [Celerinatantimonas diazotrophica]CAG9296980.1 Fe(2+) transporter FeoB [Celerinatantimonas diazotrophica]
MSNELTLCVVGNPNCGKTTLFNRLTGGRQTVGNWPGVTVDKKVGTVKIDGKPATLVDLPGIYSLSPNDSSSEDERVARDYILSGEPQLVLNIIDAANMERNLYLTLQLIEMKVPLIVIVNMMDIAKKRRLILDLDQLSKNLGCPVLGLSATRNKGIKELLGDCSKMLKHPQIPTAEVAYPEPVTHSLKEIEKILEGENITNAHWHAVQYLEFSAISETISNQASDSLNTQRSAIAKQFDDELDIYMADARYQTISEVVQSVIDRRGEVSQTATDKIDKVVLNRLWGIPIFLAIMYCMFLFTINIGSAFIDFFDILFGSVLVDGLGHLLTVIGFPQWLVVIVANGIGGGIQTVSTFIPVIGCLYLFLSFLEDSGYMARAAFVMDRFMRAIGLPGKAFVPLIVGFGCNVPAVMATRTMENKLDRIVTVMMAPFMSCGARLPVYVLFATAFFPHNGQNLVFSLYIIGIFAAVLTGFLLRRTALKGAISSFVMELPPYHIPTLTGVLIRTWERLKNFMLRAGKLIVIIVTVLSFLNSIGTDGSFGHEDSQSSVLSKIGQTITPVFHPMGMQQDNWPAAVGMFTGIFAKEAVVGTLNSLYSSLADQQNAATNTTDEPAQAPAVMDGVKDAFASIPANLSELGASLLDPLGIQVGDLSDKSAAAQNEEVDVSTIDMLSQLFSGTLGAYAYLLMVLLYIPCVAAIAAIWREVGTRWTIFAACWTTGLGYGLAVVVYQLGTFTQHPGYSVSSIGLVIIILGAFLAWITRSYKTISMNQAQHA